MKELIKKMKNNKGISLITLTVAVSILIIITSTLIYNAKDTIEIRNLKNMYNDIELLEDKVEAFYMEFGAIPTVLDQYTNIAFLNGEDAENYYVIDLASLEGITSLNYGRDYKKIKDNTFNQAIDTDIYIINQKSHQIYYVRGIESDEELYYTNEPRTQNDDINMKITVIDSIEDLIRFEQKVNGTYRENKNGTPEASKTFEGENVVLTRNLDFEDNNSYDGSTVIIESDSYSLSGTEENTNLKAYLCKDESDENKTTGWTPIGNWANTKQFCGTFKGNNFTVSNMYINTSSGTQGLFGYVGEGGIIQDLTVDGNIKANAWVGGIAGQSKGKIENCINNSNIESTLVSETSSNAGGIVGGNLNGIVEKCKNNGNVYGEGNCIGGITGRNEGAQVLKCINTGKIELGRNRKKWCTEVLWDII